MPPLALRTQNTQMPTAPNISMDASLHFHVANSPHVHVSEGNHDCTWLRDVLTCAKVLLQMQLRKNDKNDDESTVEGI